MGKIYKQNCKGCKSYYEGRGSLFCSVACSSIDPERSRKQGFAMLGRFQNGKDSMCEECGNEFYTSRYYIKKRKFCSRKCVQENQSRVRTVLLPDKTPQYKLRQQIRDMSKTKTWRNSVFERDDYTCQACGQKGGKIQADHVVPFSEILKQNNIVTIKAARQCVELWDTLNGRTLCVKCHKVTDTYGKDSLYQNHMKTLTVYA